jgi:hypothetical protein
MYLASVEVPGSLSVSREGLRQSNVAAFPHVSSLRGTQLTSPPSRVRVRLVAAGVVDVVRHSARRPTQGRRPLAQSRRPSQIHWRSSTEQVVLLQSQGGPTPSAGEKAPEPLRIGKLHEREDSQSGGDRLGEPSLAYYAGERGTSVCERRRATTAGRGSVVGRNGDRATMIRVFFQLILRVCRNSGARRTPPSFPGRRSFGRRARGTGGAVVRGREHLSRLPSGLPAFVARP